MIGPAGAAFTPIGIDLGTRLVKAVQLVRRGAGWHLHAAAWMELPEPAATFDAGQVQRLADLLYRQGFRGHDLVLAAPAGALQTTVLELPPRTSGAPLEQIAAGELARTSKWAPGAFEMALWELPAPPRSAAVTHAMAVALRHADAQALLDPLEAAGFTVRRVDAPACALLRAVQPRAGPGMVAVLDLGWGAGTLVLGRAGVVVLHRRLGLEGAAAAGGTGGIAAWHEAFRAHTGTDARVIDHLLLRHGLAEATEEPAPGSEALRQLRAILARQADAIAGELAASFAYGAYRCPDAPVSKLLLTGGGAAVPGLRERLAAKLEVEVQAIGPADLVDCPPEGRARAASPMLTLALGLAQRETAQPAAAINLIPVPRRLACERRRRLTRWAAACAVYAGLLALGCLGARLAGGASDRAVAGELAGTIHQVELLQHQSATLRPRVVVAQRRLATVQALARQPDWSVLLSLVATTVGDDVVLRRCRLEPTTAPDPRNTARPAAPAPRVTTQPAAPARGDQYRLALDGLGQSQAAVSRFVLRLQETHLFGEVKLVRTSREPYLDTQAAAFQIECTLGPQPAPAP